MHKPIIGIVVAMDEKRGIGKDNDLLFKIPEDFKRMKVLTSGHPIIMGRRTFESIGRVLPNRTNIIVTRDEHYHVDGAIVVHSLDEALRLAQGKPGDNEIIIFGGGQLFKEALEKGIVDRLHLTLVKGDFSADTFFPDYAAFTKVISEEHKEANGYLYTFLELERQ